MDIKQIRSRREFIKQTAISMACFPLVSPFSTMSKNKQLPENAGILGRVLFNNVHSFEEPDENSTGNGTFQFNDVVDLSQPVSSPTGYAANEIWYRVEGHTFIQSKNIQLVENNLQTPRDDVSNPGHLGVITVPFSKAWPGDKQKSRSHQIFFYGSTHWIYGLGKDPDGKLYYLVIEDRWNESYYVEAAHLRIIEEKELEPISPDIEYEKKRILVDSRNQLLFAFENEKLVLVSPVSTGMQGNGTNLATPIGEHRINYKRPSRHMVHSDKIGVNDSELYGVPWVSYFTGSGVAFHGTYWHNDYTQPKSHGCVNMPIQAAKWIYLWSNPVVNPRAKKVTSKYGTLVQVI